MRDGSRPTGHLTSIYALLRPVSAASLQTRRGACAFGSPGFPVRAMSCAPLRPGVGRTAARQLMSRLLMAATVGAEPRIMRTWRVSLASKRAPGK